MNVFFYDRDVFCGTFMNCGIIQRMKSFLFQVPTIQKRNIISFTEKLRDDWKCLKVWNPFKKILLSRVNQQSIFNFSSAFFKDQRSVEKLINVEKKILLS